MTRQCFHTSPCIVITFEKYVCMHNLVSAVAHLMVSCAHMYTQTKVYNVYDFKIQMMCATIPAYILQQTQDTVLNNAYRQR